jgi:hypothetical protein
MSSVTVALPADITERVAEQENRRKALAFELGNLRLQYLQQERLLMAQLKESAGHEQELVSWAVAQAGYSVADGNWRHENGNMIKEI